MFRDLSMIILAVLFFGVSSVDAQLFRRFARPANYGQAYQQQAQQAQQAAQTSGCTCNQQAQQQQAQQQQTQQQQAPQQQTQQQQAQQQQRVAAQQSNNYRAPSTDNRRSYNAQAYNAQSASATQPSLAGQNAKQASAEGTRQVQQQLQQTQPQRYGLYYNPRTSQSILRPIRSAIAGTSNQTGQRGLLRRPQVQAVQPQVVGTPVTPRGQFDIARRPVTTPQVQPAVSNLSLNAPQPTAASPVVARNTTPIQPAIATPTGTLTSSPKPTTTPAAVQPGSAAPKKAFSILESSDDSSPELGGPVAGNKQN